ncbi:MAG: hypothetical protein AAGA54_22575 [Myxococcota bacterium]
MRRLLMLAAMGATLVGCRAKTQPVPPRQGPPAFDDDDAATPEAPATPGEDEEPKPAPAEAPGGCAASGSPWDGKLQGCLYEVSGCCYPDDASACAAAGCDAQTCQILESAPAQVRCTVAGS